MRWLRAHIVATVSAVVIAVAAAGAAVLLVGNHSPAPPKRVIRPVPVASPTLQPAASRSHRLLSPFTGEPVKSLRRILAVKIDNIVFARPQTGINSADIVYVIPVEGGLTRFLAIFSSHVPAVIGPVRSARQDDLELLHQFGRPGFAFSGAQPELLPVVERAHIVNLYAGVTSGYFRNNSRIAPYNLFAESKLLLAQSKHASKAHSIGFTFGAAPADGAKLTSKTVRYPAASYRFTWSPARKRWLVWIDGRRAMTTEGKQMDPTTVVIQYTNVITSVFKEEGLRPPYAETVGHGTVLVLRNGRAYQGHWSRPGQYRGTAFTTEGGKPLNFAPGQVWVVLTAKNKAGFNNERQ
jgi:Protein of unknown function (DUF3048) N-terminal domain/Protein of unknown function (DUF3048) C-terminal domain